MQAMRVVGTVIALGGVLLTLVLQPGLDTYRTFRKQVRLHSFEQFLASHPFSQEHDRRLEDAALPEDPGARSTLLGSTVIASGSRIRVRS